MMTDLSTARPGSVITFGTYPHTAQGTDRTPIQWRVIENARGTLLVLSKHLLDCRRYHRTFAAVTWRDCDLRHWLNDAFYHAAFTRAEQKRIRATRTTDNGEATPDAVDRVFVPSEAEVVRWTERLGKEFRRARGTPFAQAKKPDGCRLYVMDKNVPDDYLTERGKKHGCSWWWLRTQGRLKEKGNDPTRVAFVGTRASIRHYARVDRHGNGVRPALRIVIAK